MELNIPSDVAAFLAEMDALVIDVQTGQIAQPIDHTANRKLTMSPSWTT
jgi:hypothetical protein